MKQIVASKLWTQWNCSMHQVIIMCLQGSDLYEHVGHCDLAFDFSNGLANFHWYAMGLRGSIAHVKSLQDLQQNVPLKERRRWKEWDGSKFKNQLWNENKNIMRIALHPLQTSVRETQIMQDEIMSSGFSLPRVLPMGNFGLDFNGRGVSSFNIGNYLI